jgi:hypothetical protein
MTQAIDGQRLRQEIALTVRDFTRHLPALCRETDVPIAAGEEGRRR